MAGKFDIQKIIDDVKSIVTPAPIPEANKDDPAGYHLSELGKLVKELADNQNKQADTLAKVNAILGELYQELAAKGAKAPAVPAPSSTEAEIENTEAKPEAEALAKSDEPAVAE